MDDRGQPGAAGAPTPPRAGPGQGLAHAGKARGAVRLVGISSRGRVRGRAVDAGGPASVPAARNAVRLLRVLARSAEPLPGGDPGPAALPRSSTLPPAVGPRRRGLRHPSARRGRLRPGTGRLRTRDGLHQAGPLARLARPWSRGCPRPRPTTPISPSCTAATSSMSSSSVRRAGRPGLRCRRPAPGGGDGQRPGHPRPAAGGAGARALPRTRVLRPPAWCQGRARQVSCGPRWSRRAGWGTRSRTSGSPRARLGRRRGDRSGRPSGGRAGAHLRSRRSAGRPGRAGGPSDTDCRRAVPTPCRSSAIGSGPCRPPPTAPDRALGPHRGGRRGRRDLLAQGQDRRARGDCCARWVRPRSSRPWASSPAAPPGVPRRRLGRRQRRRRCAGRGRHPHHPRVDEAPDPASSTRRGRGRRRFAPPSWTGYGAGRPPPSRPSLARVILSGLRIGALAGVMVDAVAAASGVTVPTVRRAVMLSDLGGTAVLALTSGTEGGGGGRPAGRHTGVPDAGRDGAFGSAGAAVTTLGRASVEYKGSTGRGSRCTGPAVRAARSGCSPAPWPRSRRGCPSWWPSSTASPVGADPRRRDPRADRRRRATAVPGDDEPVRVDLGRDEVLRPWFFDVLHADGSTSSTSPLQRRRKCCGPSPAHVVPSLRDRLRPDAADELGCAALAAGHEGVVVKDLARRTPRAARVVLAQGQAGPHRRPRGPRSRMGLGPADRVAVEPPSRGA